LRDVNVAHQLSIDVCVSNSSSMSS
jgi:hypothetical protein